MNFFQILLIAIFLISLNTNQIQANDVRGEFYEYDAGPDITTEVGRGYAQIMANTPNYREIGRRVLPGSGEKFRWKFGPMFYRGRLGENQVKVLIIGQEGAQDENVSDRSFTGGTGGRMQNFLNSLGIDQSYLFINTFVYTIKGQYADYAPVYNPYTGKLSYKSILTDEMYKLAQTPQSPLVQHRHNFLDHIIKSNRNSLKLVIAVGGAARDSLATYIMDRGGKCDPYNKNPRATKKINYGKAWAGGNKSFYFPIDKDGDNLLVRRGEVWDFSNRSHQSQLKARLNYQNVLENIITYDYGPQENGFISQFQLGANLESCVMSGERETLKGIFGIKNDIRFIHVLHPGSNSSSLEAKFKAKLKKLRHWDQYSAWKLPADNGMKQPFDYDFRYTHKPIPRRDFRFGLSSNIGWGNTTSTRRDGGAAIEMGGRSAASYDTYLEKRSLEGFFPGEWYYSKNSIDVPWEPTKSRLDAFDPGPGTYWAKVFTGDHADIPPLPIKKLQNFMVSGNVFGANIFYRGRLENSKVLVLADQHSHDDLWVGRALTGYHGQKLQAFLESIDSGLDYSILRTLPFDSLELPRNEKEEAFELTRKWRNAIFNKIIEKNQIKLILTLGEWADWEVEKLDTNNIPIVKVTDRYEEAFREVKDLAPWNTQDMFFYNDVFAIAREDIPFGMKRWVGTAGDRVIRSVHPEGSHHYFKLIAPNWNNNARAPYLTEQEKNDLKAAGLL